MSAMPPIATEFCVQRIDAMCHLRPTHRSKQQSYSSHLYALESFSGITAD
jgi:hypothetical protein